MFASSHKQSDGELAHLAWGDESMLRFAAFSAADATTLGLSLRKRFRVSSRHARGRGLVLTIRTVAGHNLFSCTVGDLSSSEVGLGAWDTLEDMVEAVRFTGHSSYYLECGLRAAERTPRDLGLRDRRIQGGAFPIWLVNAPCSPIAIVAACSGDGAEDHKLVVTAVRDYLQKVTRDAKRAAGDGDSMLDGFARSEMDIPSQNSDNR